MEFKSLASGSSGNCYILSDGEDRIMIEAGIPWKKVQKALKFNTQGIKFCLISHLHNDHAGHLKSVLKAGIPCCAPYHVWQHLGLMNHHLRYGVSSIAVDFYETLSEKIKTFPVVHDVPCVGLLIAKGSERVLYLTDCLYSPVRFKDLTMILLGVNYSKNTISEDIHPAHRKHIIQDHMSLETAKELLKANDLSKVREIHLLHLSKHNSDAELFIKDVQALTGKPVFVA